MYACICERVRESDVRLAIRCGAHTEESVGAACGAGTGCGSCLDRICELIDEETATRLVAVGA
ncbi:MAG TPA: (2Fe-2S)-binding protein [Micromonosporaceae bacterium]|jgi:bacterioferritin-associated ferredoxin